MPWEALVHRIAIGVVVGLAVAPAIAGTVTGGRLPFQQGVAVNNAGTILGKDRRHPTEFYLHSGASTQAVTVPGAREVQPVAINAAGTVVGYAANNAGTHFGFLFKNGSVSTIGCPGTSDFVPAWMNDSETITGQADGRAMIWHDGTCTFFAVDGATSTLPAFINNQGVIVGTAFAGSQVASGFIDDHGTITEVSRPGFAQTWFQSINDSGLILGYNQLGNGAFLYDAGSFVDLPVFTAAALNNEGRVTGETQPPEGGATVGYVYSYPSAALTLYPVVAGYSVGPSAINDSAMMTGVAQRNAPYGLSAFEATCSGC